MRLPRYLSESNWVQDQLFGIHEGDIETDIDPGVGRPVSTTYDITQPSVAMETTSKPAPAPAPAPAPQQQQPVATANSNNKSTIKVKIMYKDEIFAIKVPVPSSVEFLRGKVVDRLGFDVNLMYKSGDHLTDLNTETFEAAVKLGKLTVVAS